MISVSLILLGLWMLWVFLYLGYWYSQYDFAGFGASDWVDLALYAVVGVAVLIFTYFSYPRQRQSL